ncbi:unnamed protein product [Mytilus coruscus]|uniref:B box-type domain-containing protein n=1 Tax=Mytilus coruscus TaxID=42192 RepID=A0A6J8B2W2_MYTCO|nr:unnamed protein product [Mytilus coruscus]
MCHEQYTYCSPVEEFCKSCSKPICSVFRLDLHKGHKTEPFQMTVAKARTSLSVALRGLKSRLPLLEYLLNEAVHEEKKYNNHIKNRRVEINELSERLKLDVCRNIDEITDENICKLDSLAHTDKAVLESYKKDVNRSKKTIDWLFIITVMIFFEKMPGGKQTFLRKIVGHSGKPHYNRQVLMNKISCQELVTSPPHQ